MILKDQVIDGILILESVVKEVMRGWRRPLQPARIPAAATPAKTLEPSEQHLIGLQTPGSVLPGLAAQQVAHSSSGILHATLHHAIVLSRSGPRQHGDLRRLRIGPTSPDTHRVPGGRALHHTYKLFIVTLSRPGGGGPRHIQGRAGCRLVLLIWS